MSCLFKRGGFGLLLLLTLMSVGVRLWLMQGLDEPLRVPAEGAMLEIAPGQGLRAVALQLERDDRMSHTDAWWLCARLSGRGTRIQAGEYALTAGLNGRRLLDMLASGRVFQRQVTLVEGWTLRQALEFLQAQPKVRKTLEPSDQVALLEALDRRFPHPEGLIFPDTYKYAAGTTDRELLRRAYQRMLMVLETEWQRRDDNLPYESAYQALIMASIVEKETGQAVERPHIAGVFVERLVRGMRLETDPTVIYGLGDRYRGNITREHLREATPYNTYAIKGLPPSPIALPGREAIRAALHPVRDGALYFVARGDGSHQFSRTLEEHQAAVQKFQIEQRAKEYRSKPAEGVPQ